MNRVVLTNPIIGFCCMQVCAVEDATDEEILEACNMRNPSGTENGWSRVIRTEADLGGLLDIRSLPIDCASVPGRVHYLVAC